MMDKGKGRMMDDFYVWGLSNYVEADDTFFTGGRWGSNNNSPSPPVSLTVYNTNSQTAWFQKTSKLLKVIKDPKELSFMCILSIDLRHSNFKLINS